MHCVIIGFDREEKTPARLFTYATVKAEPYQIPVKQQINGYLIDGPLLFVDKRMQPLSPMLIEPRYGTKTADGGNLIVEKDQYAQVAAEQIAAKYLRPFIGARELIHGLERWCLWMADDDFSPQDINRSPILKTRIAAVREMRLASKKKPTQECALTPHLFQENRQPDCNYAIIPSVFSETRRFATVAYVDAKVVASNAVFTMPDPEGFAFAIFCSSMFITWQRAVGGRLKSDLRFSNTLVWNNLPLPPLDAKLREQIIQAGRGVLAARALHPERSLAEHYHPLAMAPELIKAHAELDRYVDKAFGATKPLASNEDRLPVLFERYAELSGQVPSS